MKKEVFNGRRSFRQLASEKEGEARVKRCQLLISQRSQMLYACVK